MLYTRFFLLGLKTLYFIYALVSTSSMHIAYLATVIYILHLTAFLLFLLYVHNKKATHFKLQVACKYIKLGIMYIYIRYYITVTYFLSLLGIFFHWNINYCSENTISGTTFCLFPNNNTLHQNLTKTPQMNIHYLWRNTCFWYNMSLLYGVLCVNDYGYLLVQIHYAF